MPIYKVTLIFESNGQGWTESYYLNTTLSGDADGVYVPFAQPLSNLRLALLGTGAYLTDVRISTYGTPNKVFVEADGRQGTYAASAAIPNNALLVRCLPLPLGPAKSLFLRGIPQSIIVNQNYAPTTAWVSAYNAWAAFLAPPAAQPWGWMGVASKVKTPITGYTVTDGFQVLVTTQTTPFTVTNPPSKINVRFTGINGKSELNGTQVVIAQTTSSVLTVDQFGVIPWQRGGFVTTQTIGFKAFGYITPERIMTRKAGRPLFEEAGRAKARSKT